MLSSIDPWSLRQVVGAVMSNCDEPRGEVHKNADQQHRPPVSRSLHHVRIVQIPAAWPSVHSSISVLNLNEDSELACLTAFSCIRLILKLDQSLDFQCWNEPKRTLQGSNHRV